MNQEESIDVALFLLRSVEKIALSILTGDYDVADMQQLFEGAGIYANDLENRFGSKSQD